MEIYIIMLIIAVVFAILADNQKKEYKKLIYTLLAFLPIIIVSSVRYDVGTDYMFRYVPDYQKMVLGNDVVNLEPLFKLLIKLCIFISKDYVVLFVVTSILTYGIIGIAIFRNSKNILLSVTVFILGAFFFESLNLVRQFLGMAIMIYAYRYILDKKYFKWFILLIISSMIHTSCLIFLITLFLDKKVFKLSYLMIIIGLICFAGYPLMKWGLSVLGSSSNANIQKYIAYISWGEKGLHLSAVISEILIYLYYYLIYWNKKEKIGKEGIFFINLQSMTIIFLFLNIFNALFFRILLMFSIFQILSVPYFWSLYHEEEKNNLRKTVITQNTLCCIFIICVLTTKLVYSYVIKGSCEVFPYKTIWERDTIEGVEDDV